MFSQIELNFWFLKSTNEHNHFRFLNIVEIVLFDYDSHYYLCEMITDAYFRDRGYATKLLNLLLKFTNKPIMLHATPTRDKPITKEKLFEFYSRIGFKNTIGNEFVFGNLSSTKTNQWSYYVS